MTAQRRPALAARLAAAWFILTLVGCAASTTASPTPAAPTPAAAVSPAPSAASANPSSGATPSVTPSSTPEASCAERTLAGMTEAQRIGQVFIIGLEKDVLNAAERAAVADFHVASRTRRRPRSRWAKAVALRAASDDAFRTRVDDAALHVLRAKEATGLLSCGG